MKIKVSKQSVLILGAVAVCLLVVSVFGYWNLATRLGTLRAEIDDKEDRLESSEQIARRLNAVEERYGDALADLSALEQGVSRKEYVPTLLRQIEELGESMNLRVVGVRPKVEPRVVTQSEDDKESQKKPDPYDRLNIELDVKGKYWDVVSFVYQVTSFPKIIAVNSLQVTPEGTACGTDSPTLSVRLQTTAFILRETGSTGKVDEKWASAPVPGES